MKWQISLLEAIQTYKIKLPQFEGPFDLLLFFIERDELDIYDIPIAQITTDFLNYIREMEQLNVEVASEFILVAATLMRIKSKMLLPRKELDEEGNEIDPREELVQRLIEYKKYKEVTNALRSLEQNRQQYEKRGNASLELGSIMEQHTTEAELHALDLYKILKAFQRVLLKMEARAAQPTHTVTRYHYTISDQKNHILSFIGKKEKASFDRIFSVLENRVHAIFTFLALLELIQEKQILIQIGLGTNNFWIQQHESAGRNKTNATDT